MVATKGGSVVRVAYIIEALISYFSGAVFVFKPELLIDPYFPPNTVHPQTTLLVTKWWGAANLIIAVLLTLGSLESGFSSRKLIYQTLLAGEFIYTPIFYFFVQELGYGWNAGAIGTMAFVVGFAVWRIICLLVLPSLFGKATYKKRNTRKSK